MLKPPMKPLLGRVVLNDVAARNFLNQAVDGQGPARDAVAGRARPCDAYRPALQHEPAK